MPRRASARGDAAGRRRRPRRSRRPLVDRVQQPVQLEVGELAQVAQRAGELRLAVADAGEPADELRRPSDGERVQVDVAPVGIARELERRQGAGAPQVVDLVVALVVQARSRPSTTGCRGRGTSAARARARRRPASPGGRSGGSRRRSARRRRPRRRPSRRPARGSAGCGTGPSSVARCRRGCLPRASAPARC